MSPMLEVWGQKSIGRRHEATIDFFFDAPLSHSVIVANDRVKAGKRKTLGIIVC